MRSRHNSLIDRRDFLKAAGVTFLSSLAPSAFADTLAADAVFATAFRRRDGAYGAAILSEAGKILHDKSCISCHARMFGGDGSKIYTRADPAKYRPAEEVEKWLAHDPLDLARTRLQDMGLSPALIDEADQRAAHVVAQAIEAAKAAPPADPAEALTDVWADGGAQWRT